MKKRELLEKILVFLSEINPVRAKKLARLMKAYDTANTDQDKKAINKKIYDFVYETFFKLLSKPVADKLFEYNCSINECCYKLEHYYQYRWLVDERGAFMPSYDEEGNPIRVNEIPRSYVDGYKLPDDKTLSIELVDFYLANERRLDNISDFMDKKLELVTYHLDFKDPNISTEFTELLISYLGIRRLSLKEQTKRPKDGLSFQ
ncbi:MAG: hypothetical protein IKQ29_03060 [Bacilli bacterium]|nr:hypothetical protein [Bacilli bacterium]